jgi:hypothetical protein
MLASELFFISEMYLWDSSPTLWWIQCTKLDKMLYKQHVEKQPDLGAVAPAVKPPLLLLLMIRQESMTH